MNRLSIAMLISCSLLLSACNSSTANDGEKLSPTGSQNIQDQTTEGSTSAPSQDTANQPTKTPEQPVGYKYDATTENFADKGITISYPKLSGLQDTAKQTLINDTIKQYALFAFDQYKDNEKKVTVNISYELKLQDDRLLSIAYSGVGHVEGANHPNHLYYTTNIDLETGKLKRLQDAVNVDESFAQKVKSGEYRGHQGKENLPLKTSVHDWISQMKDQEIVDSLKDADFTEPYNPDNSPQSFSYYTKDSLVVSLGVPHPIGDYAEIELKNEDIVSNKKN